MTFLQLLLICGSSWGIIFHPDGEPDLSAWADRPPDAVVGRWGSNASCVAISPNCVITTQHQGVSTAVPVVLDGQTWRISRLWLHDSADLCIAQLDGAHLQQYVAPVETGNEAGSSVVIAGVGNGRSGLLQTSGVVYGYGYDRLPNTTLRMGTNRIDSITKNSDGIDLLIADFDGLSRKGSTLYECVPASYDSGGGWFIQQDSEWKLAGLSEWVESHYEEGHQDDPQYLIPYEAWFASRSSPLRPDPDLFGAVRIQPFVEWIKPILCQAHGGDLNQDGSVDLRDFAVIAEFWSRSDCRLTQECMGADTESDGDVDLDDLSCFLKFWLKGTSKNCPFLLTLGL
jgi:hypothetical protein